MKFTKIVASLRKTKLAKKKPFRKLLKILSNVITRLIYGKYKKILIGQKYEFLLNSKFAFSGYENWGNKHNSGFDKLLELAKDKKCVFDVGAHIGLCSLPLSKIIAKGGIIYSFEASDKNRYFLKEHIRINNINNIKTIPFLIGSCSKQKVRFFETDDVSGVPSIANLSRLNNSINTVSTNKIQISLDDFCKQNNTIPDIIKIDVEGAEFEILAGAKDIITKYKPEIIISLHPKHLKELGNNINGIFDFCKKFSYQLLSCIDGHKINTKELSLDEYYMKPIL